MTKVTDKDKDKDSEGEGEEDISNISLNGSVADAGGLDSMLNGLNGEDESFKSEPSTGLLRAARSGNLDKVLEYLNTVDINTSNANGLNALHLASKDGHVHVVEELIKRGADIDASTKKGNTSLHIAALAGQEEVVRLLVSAAANVNVQSQNGFTPLYMAAQENHDGVVKFLLANGANQSLATEDGFTPLAVAMQQGHDKVVALLLEHDTRGKVRLPALHIAAKKNDCHAAGLLLQNSQPDVTSKSKFTPLHIAAHYGNTQVAGLLLDRGADVNYPAKHNITPLHVAAKWGKSGVAGLLIERGADVAGKTRDGLTPLHCAARSGHETLVDLLLEKSAPISAKTKNGLAPLHMAAQGDHVDAARILLFHKAPVDDVTIDYLTALHVAAHCGHVRVAKLLLDKSADPNARALNGFTPLHIACKKNRIKVVELLLKHGALIEATTESGLSPLHVASFMGCMNIAIYLLQNGAKPDSQTVRGETPLHLAARANQVDIVRILIRNGASVDSKAREDQTPLHIAARLGNSDLVMLLLQHGANVDSQTKEMYTALHVAAKEGQEEVASILLESGADPEARTKRGNFTPLHLASKHGHLGVAKLLVTRGASLDPEGKNNLTPLHLAIHHSHTPVAMFLLNSKACSNLAAKNGYTPLHIASKNNQIEVAKDLIHAGVDVNAESKNGFTPLHLASLEGHEPIVKLLLDAGALASPPGKNGLTPLHLTAQEDRLPAAKVLLSSGHPVDPRTEQGYSPLHVASHFGHCSIVRQLLASGADVEAETTFGNTPLHHAAQQGQAMVITLLLEKKADPDRENKVGHTPLAIAEKLNYVTVIETLKTVTTVTKTIEERYKVLAPETINDPLPSDTEDEQEETHDYRYLTVDDMKSLGDDSLPIDVTRDEIMHRDSGYVLEESALSATQSQPCFSADNVDISKTPIQIGFLVSFMVDARGGAMRGCRHSGIRIIIPPKTAPAPMRITCKYLRKERLLHPPPLMEGEALASRVLELGPGGVKFLGKVVIEVPHFASLRSNEREIVILRSENGETWREHTEEGGSDIIAAANEKEEDTSPRITRIVTSDFPQYFALVSRVKQEVHAVGPEGGVVTSTVVPSVSAVFPNGALTKRIKVGLQAHPLPQELVGRIAGSRVAVSPIVTVEPRRRKFHKPITLSIPVPKSSDPNSSLRLLCSITGPHSRPHHDVMSSTTGSRTKANLVLNPTTGGTTRAQWEDVTGSTPLTFLGENVSFTTTVSARFWLVDSRHASHEVGRLATELYREAITVPFMAKFVVFAKRIEEDEARLRVFCMTDDREEKTLEGQENFTEVAKSRDVEVLEGKPQWLDVAGNLVPITKSGEQLRLKFYAFRENRLPFLVRLRDGNAGGVGRIMFTRESRTSGKSNEPSTVCTLNITLPDRILPDEPSAPVSLSASPRLPLSNRYSLKTLLSSPQICKADLRISDVANLLGRDWIVLASELGIHERDVGIIESEYRGSDAQQATVMLRLWMQSFGDRATGNTLEKALSAIGRSDIVESCISSLAPVTDKEEIHTAKSHVISTDVEKQKQISYDEEDIMKDSESLEDLNVESGAGDTHEMITSYERDEQKYVPEEKAGKEDDDGHDHEVVTRAMKSNHEEVSMDNKGVVPEEPQKVEELSVQDKIKLFQQGDKAWVLTRAAEGIQEKTIVKTDLVKKQDEELKEEAKAEKAEEKLDVKVESDESKIVDIVQETVIDVIKPEKQKLEKRADSISKLRTIEEKTADETESDNITEKSEISAMISDERLDSDATSTKTSIRPTDVQFTEECRPESKTEMIGSGTGTTVSVSASTPSETSTLKRDTGFSESATISEKVDRGSSPVTFGELCVDRGTSPKSDTFGSLESLDMSNKSINSDGSRRLSDEDDLSLSLHGNIGSTPDEGGSSDTSDNIIVHQMKASSTASSIASPVEIIPSITTIQVQGSPTKFSVHYESSVTTTASSETGSSMDVIIPSTTNSSSRATSFTGSSVEGSVGSRGSTAASTKSDSKSETPSVVSTPEQDLIEAEANSIINQIEDRIEERMQMQEPSSSSAEFFTARESISNRDSRDSSTLFQLSAATSSETIHTPTRGENDKSITCEMGSPEGLPVTITSTSFGNTTSTQVTKGKKEPTFDNVTDQILVHHAQQLEFEEPVLMYPETLLPDIPEGSGPSESSSLNEFEKLESVVEDEWKQELSQVDEVSSGENSESTNTSKDKH